MERNQDGLICWRISMQILNLIRPEKSDVKYEVIQFPDGEPHIVLNGIDRAANLWS